jgi:hypothetical protein
LRSTEFHGGEWAWIVLCKCALTEVIGMARHSSSKSLVPP